MCVRVVTTNHSNTSTGIQYHQQWLRLRASEPWRSPAAAGKPCPCSRQDVFSSKFRAQVVVLHQQYHPVPKCNHLLIIILKPKLSHYISGHSGVRQYFSVRKCNTILAIILIPKRPLHFRIYWCDLPEKLKLHSIPCPEMLLILDQNNTKTVLVLYFRI